MRTTLIALAVPIALTAASAAADVGASPSEDEVRAVRLLADMDWDFVHCGLAPAFADASLPIALTGLNEDELNSGWPRRTADTRRAMLDRVADEKGEDAACRIVADSLGPAAAPPPPLETSADGYAVERCARAVKREMPDPDRFRPTAPGSVSDTGPSTWLGLPVSTAIVEIAFEAAGPSDIFYSQHRAICKIARAPSRPKAFRLIDLSIDGRPAALLDPFKKVRLTRPDPACTVPVDPSKPLAPMPPVGCPIH